ncbi:MAG: CRISPR-associated endonuclease Cas2 [Pirellulales bacterium]|nr:CRISPR-associated endonuclease Cas2 [Pirellulales bacterium]
MAQMIVAYDISAHGARQRVARVLLNFGRRVQRSVFEIQATPEDLREIRRQIGPLLSPHDAFDIYPVDMRNLASRIRWQKPPRNESVILA